MNSMRLKRLSLAAGLFCTFGFAHAGTLWATASDGNLYTVDTDTVTATLIGQTGAPFASLAYDEVTGRLFSSGEDGALYELSTTDGSATEIGSTGIGNIEGMDFAGSFLYAFNFDDTPSIYQIDPNTGAASLTITSDTNTGVVRTFAFTPDYVNALMATGSPADTLYAMPISGVTSTVGTLDTGIAGMDFIGDDLFGLGANGAVWSIDPTTGAQTFLGSTGDQFWQSAATKSSPVPEPASLAVIGLGLAALARRRKRFPG